MEKLKTPPPSFVKANAKKPKAEENKPRKKREAKHNRARQRAVPTQIVEHRIVSCPDCHLRLGGISLARLREVIDVPPPPRIEVTHHRIYKGWCAGCQKWHEAPVDVQAEVLGQGRIGVRLASMMAYLRTVLRLPIRQIQQMLFTLHGFPVSAGAIVELLHRIKEHAQPVLRDLKARIRASPAVQADETGWREDGTNGYVWSAATPTIRYYEYHHSRAGEVVKELIGENFQGVLGSDFYAGYNIHQGLHQRCWVHFLRDVHDLKEDFPHDEELLTWAKAVKAIYEQAVAWAEHGPDPALSSRKQQQARVGQQHVFEQRLWKACQPFAHTSAPQHTLCQRVERFLPELFVFVAVPGVPAHNNLAERSIRPLVVARKISGGSRSPKGSDTRMGLASLFGTWMAQHLNPERIQIAIAEMTGASPTNLDVSEVSPKVIADAQEEIAQTIGLKLGAVRKFNQMVVTAVASHSFGIVVVKEDKIAGHWAEVISNLILVNDPLPASVSLYCTTYEANQEFVEFKLMENSLQEQIVEDLSMGDEIGSAILPLPPHLPAGTPIEVTFQLDRQGRLSIIGREPSNGAVIETHIETHGSIPENELRIAQSRLSKLIVS